MTTSPQTPRSAFVGDGVTASFDTGFTFELATEVRVTVEAAGVTTVAAYSVDYDLSGVAADWLVSGADVVFRVGAIPPAGAIVTLRRATQIDQPDDFGDDQSFAPSQMEASLDRVVRILQEEDLAREDSEGEVGPAGAQGYPGWSPVFAVVTDGARRVLRVTSWTGGGGSAPTSPVYVGASGFTTVLADAIDIRGAVGATGSAGTNGTDGVDGADGLDAPQIDDATTAPDKVWSSDKIDAEIAAVVAGAFTGAYSSLTGIPAPIDAIDGLTPAADRFAYYTGASSAALAALTAFGRSLIDDADATAGRATLGLVINTDVQAYSANLATFAAIAPSANVQTLLGAANYAAFRTSLGLVINTDVQAYSANLATFAAIAPSANVQTLLATANFAAFRSSLGLGTIATFDEATAAQFQANTSGKALSTDKVWSAADLVTLTDAATIAVDMATFINAVVTLGGSRTLGNPTNTKSQSGVIKIVQDGTGSRTLAYSSNWKFAGGTAPVLTTTAAAVDLLFYQVIDSTHIYASLVKDVK